MSALRFVRFGLWGLIVVIVAGVTATALGVFPPKRGESAQQGVVQIGGPFELTAMNGEKQAVPPAPGTPYAVFFGFTFCPDVCPTSMYDLTTWLDELGDAAGDVNVYFVSVDPERDTPDVLENYISVFNPRIVGMTGTAEEIAAVAQTHRAYYKRVELDDGDYTMDHTASIYLFDGDGEFFGTIAYGEQGDTALEKLRRLAKTAKS